MAVATSVGKIQIAFMVAVLKISGGFLNALV